MTYNILENREVIDLSPLLVPGKEKRRLTIRSFIAELDKTTMCDIDMMSHLGAHVESPLHFNSCLPDISSLDIRKFFGEAVCVDLRYKKPREAILVKDLDEHVKEGDIVLLHSGIKGEDAPYISKETAEWLSKRIKMLGIDDTINLEESYDLMASHKHLLENNIPIIEMLTNLDKVAGKRFIYIGLPLKIKGLDSSPIRAIAIL
ncbi:MAG: cyclase family protein [Nitrososphaeria archaeon]|nr:cyclase family protein [Nitrososphaeria archaeon]